MTVQEKRGFAFAEPETTPSRSGDTTCQVFAWVGQSFKHCGECGRPYWEHLYEPVFGSAKGDFRVKHYVKWRAAWVWREVTVITPTMAERCRARWAS